MLGHTVTKDEELLSLAGSDLREQGEEVVGNTLGVFAHDTAGVRASRVEVAQESTVPLLSLLLLAGLDQVVALGVDHVGDGGLDGDLGVAVGVGWAERAVLGDGDHVGEAGRVAVDGGRAGEDNVVDVVADHGAQEAEGALDIDAVVVEGLLGGFSNGLHSLDLDLDANCEVISHLEGSKVNHAVNVGILLKDAVERSLVGDVKLDELGPLAADQLDAVDDLFGRVVQVVRDDDLVAGLEEGQGREGANVAGATARERSAFMHRLFGAAWSGPTR